MQKRSLTRAASLIPLVGILLAAGPAWAQATKTPIEGEWFRCWNLEDPEKDWQDEDGVRHVRNSKFACMHRGDIHGLEIGWESFDGKNPPGTGATGRYYTSFRGEVLGEMVRAVGRGTFDCDRVGDVRICTEEAIWHLDDGSLVKFSGVHDFGAYRPYSGVVVDPPGRD